MTVVSVELLSLWLLLTSTTVVPTQYASPFFYLCSFQQSNVDQSSEDVGGQLALSVTIDGDPQFYVPGQLYNGKTTFFKKKQALLSQRGRAMLRVCRL